MDKIRNSLNGFKSMFTNLFQGNPIDENEQDDLSSSSEEIECGTDCSLCATENQSLSLVSSNASKDSIRHQRHLHKLAQQQQQQEEVVRKSIEHQVKRIQRDSVQNSREVEILVNLSQRKVQNVPGEINTEGKDSKSINLFPQSQGFGTSSRRVTANFVANSHEGTNSKNKRKYDEISTSEQKQQQNSLLAVSIPEPKRASAQTAQNHISLLQSEQKNREESLKKSLGKLSLNEIEQKIEQKVKIIEVAKQRKTEILSRPIEQTKRQQQLQSNISFSSFQNQTKIQANYQIPKLTLDRLQVPKMVIERAFEIIGEFQTVCVEPKSSEHSMIQQRDPDFFKLSKSKFEINKNYYDLIEKTLLSASQFGDDVVIDCEKANYRLTKSSLSRLKPRQWFNDEIINGYVALLNQREKDLGLNNVFAFNTFFFTMINDQLKRGEYDYKRLERVVSRKKVNLRNYKQILLPVNIEHTHWFLLCADLIEDKIYIIDSMTHREDLGQQFAKTFKKFLQDYFHNNKGGRMKFEENLELWRSEIVKSIPSQNNGFDCGMCLCLNMDSLSRSAKVEDIKYEVTQEFSEETRRRISVELWFGQLLTEVGQITNQQM